ncbi:MAG: MBL fold metallo-hydrolase, partial [Thermoplasmata archaeon]
MRFIILGSAQDGGVPHVGCQCSTCVGAREGTVPRRLASSAAVVHRGSGRAWLVDASPDLPAQLEVVADALPGPKLSGIPLSGVLLTHIHMGHYWGLGHLGKEGMMPKGLPVLGPPRTAEFLRENRPFKDMAAWGALDIRSVKPGDDLTLAKGVAFCPIAVPHRDDFSDTVAWLVLGPKWHLLYAPDMDHVEDDFVDLVSRVDMAIIDGTFYTADEIPGAMGTVPHPPVEETMERLRPALEGGTRIAFTHLNHTNPLCDPRSP